MLNRSLSQGLLALLLLLALESACHALVSLEDEELSEQTGEGLAFALENFRFMMKPTSYLEQIGSSTPTNCPTAACTVSNGNPTWSPATYLAPTNSGYMSFTRGDLRWYGLTMSSVATDLTNWDESACATTGFNNLGCPRGGYTTNFASFDNPYVIRAFQYSDVRYDGTSGVVTVLDVLAPSQQDNYKFSFWGEAQIGKNATCAGTGCASGTTLLGLKSQTIIQGNAAGSILRLYKFTNAADPTLGLFYHSRLRGDFRFSVAQSGTPSQVIGTPVVFNAREGLHFRNVDAFLPLGQLNYQALILNSTPANDGNFFLELTAIPNTTNVANRFYAAYAGDTTGYATVLCKLRGGTYCTGLTVNANYDTTHGWSRWGDFFCNPWCANTTVGGNWNRSGTQLEAPVSVSAATIGTRNLATDTADGIFFASRAAGTNFTTYAATYVACSGATVSNCGIDTRNSVPDGGALTSYSVARDVVNLGDSRFEGIQFNHLKITSLGANYP